VYVSNTVLSAENKDINSMESILKIRKRKQSGCDALECSKCFDREVISYKLRTGEKVEKSIKISV
jgi:hypothetical protein